MTLAMNRRNLLSGLAMAGLASASGLARPAAHRRFFERVGKPIGLQLYTLGEDPVKDLDGTLAKVAAIGYRDIELPSLLGKTPVQLRAAADKAGLRLTCLHLPAPGMAPPGGVTLASSPQQVADTLGVMGMFEAVVPITPFPTGFSRKAGEDFRAMFARALAEGGADHWKRTADTLNKAAAALKPFGIMLGYHNHNVEFTPIGDQTGWDILTAHTDPALVHFELDLGWVAASGRDPVAFLHQHKGRVRWIHVKDLLPTTKSNTALSMDPTEVGSGKQDWARILPAAEAAGVQHYYVEQEPPFAMPRIEAARKSFEYLAKLRA